MPTGHLKRIMSQFWRIEEGEVSLDPVAGCIKLKVVGMKEGYPWRTSKLVCFRLLRNSDAMNLERKYKYEGVCAVKRFHGFWCSPLRVVCMN